MRHILWLPVLLESFMITNGFVYSILAGLSILSSGGLRLGLILGIFGSKLAAECAAGCFFRDISCFPYLF